MTISNQARVMHDQVANWQRNQACMTRDGCYHTERDSNDRHVLTSFERPVCPQTDAVRLLLNRAMKHLYLFVIDTGVAVLRKYEVGETL